MQSAGDASSAVAAPKGRAKAVATARSVPWERVLALLHAILAMAEDYDTAVRAGSADLAHTAASLERLGLVDRVGHSDPGAVTFRSRRAPPAARALAASLGVELDHMLVGVPQ
jgi:hypothetical protein